MRVLFISSDNNRASGAFLSLVELCKELNIRFDVETQIVLSEYGDGIEILNKEGITFSVIRSFHWIDEMSRLANNPFRYVKWIIKFLYNIIAQRRITKLIRNFRPDIVHINTSYSYVGAKPAINNKTPLVWHLREYLEEGQGLQIVFPKYGYKLMSKSNMVICVSEGLKRKYDKLLNNKNILHIYNGINENRFISINKSIFMNNTVNLLIVGGLYPEKGQMTLIKACKMLIDNGIKNFVLRIVGRGIDEDNLRKKIKEYGLDKYVFMCGFATEPERYYSDADITVVASKEEAFGRVIVEAMMSGCLVISSRFSVAQEIIGDEDRGLLFNYSDYTQLYQKIIYAIEHKDEMRQIVNYSREKAIRDFSSSQNARNVFDAYRLVLNNGN